MAQSKFDLKAKFNFKKFNQTVRQDYKNSVLYLPVYPKTEELNPLNELPVQIIQFSLQKLYVEQKIFPLGHETTKLIREKKKKRRELKRTNGEQYKFLKKEINFLQREIKWSMKRLEKIKQSKLIASAQNKGSKSLWRAVEALCGDSKNQMKLNKVSYKQLRAKTDFEKCEIFKSLLHVTMKDHISENLELNEHFKKVENETKMFLQYKNTEPNNYCIIKVDDYEEILNKTRRSSPGPDKISHNILKRLPKCLKAYICLLITSSINNSHVPTTWKESQFKMLLQPKKQKRCRKLPTIQPNQLHCKNL